MLNEAAKTTMYEDLLLRTMGPTATQVAHWTAFFALSTATVGEDGSGLTEPSGKGYARIPIAFSVPTGSPRTVLNASEIVFSATGGDWGEITDAAICSHATSTGATAIRYHGSLGTSRIINDGDSLIFSIGDIKVRES